MLLPTYLSSTIEALERALTPGRGAKSKAISREVVRRAKMAHRAQVREVVFNRADGQCEVLREPSFRCLGNAAELHHVFGRGRAESVQTCIAACRFCHQDITRNIPSAAVCWRSMVATLSHLGLRKEAERAKRRLDFVLAKKRLGSFRAAAIPG